MPETWKKPEQDTKPTTFINENGQQVSVINPSNSNTLLLYQVLTIPDPIQVSSADGDIQYATLEIIASKPRSTSPVTVQEINLDFVVGNPNAPQAGELTDSNQPINAVCSDNAWGGVSSEDGSFAFTPTSGNYIVDANSLVFTIPRIPVNTIPGTFSIKVTETASATDQNAQKRVASFQIGKAPYGFFVGDLTTSQPIVAPGTDVILQWTGSQGAQYLLQWVDANGPHSVDVSHQNSYTVPALQQTTLFYLTVTEAVNGSNIIVQRSLTVTVRTVSVKLEVDTPFVGLGQQFTIRWTSQEADACVLYSPFTPSGETEAPNGSKTYQVDANQQPSITFTITATNKTLGTSNHDQLVVTVEAPIIDLFQASCGDKPVEAGTEVTLKWKTRFASQCSLDQGIGPVQSSEETKIHPQNTTTVTLTCQGYQKPAILPLTVHVIRVQIRHFGVVPTVINPFDEAFLNWIIDHATSASISGIGPVKVKNGKIDSVGVMPIEDTDYVMTCEGPDGPIHSDTVHLTVNSVKFTHTSGTLDSPNDTLCTISWQTANATAVSILDPWSNQHINQPLSGSYHSHTYADSTQDFIITARGPGKSPVSITVSVTGPFD